jgi:uncharacterized protein with PQ loop repeat
MWALPFQTMAENMNTLSLGQTNTIPFLAMIFSCAGWSIFGLCKKDYYIFCSAILGVAAGAYYSLLSVIILTANKEVESAQKHVNAIVSTTLFWSVIGIIAGIILTKTSSQRNDASLLVGIICDIASISYYAAPLSTLVTVIRKHDSSSLNLPTIILNTVNNLMWSIYGLIAINNPLVWVPSVIGFLLGGLQIFVIFTYHAKVVVVAVSRKVIASSRKYFSRRNGSNAPPVDESGVAKQGEPTEEMYKSLHVHKFSNAGMLAPSGDEDDIESKLQDRSGSRANSYEASDANPLVSSSPLHDRGKTLQE